MVDGWREAGAVRKVSPLLLVNNHGRPPLALDWERRVIAHNREMDIATFEITADEVESIGKRVLRGAERAWPPNPPQVDRGSICAASRV